MATQKTYTQEQLKKAQEALEALPDFSRDKITKPDFIDSLREQIITLSSIKGYSQAEIKSALASVGVIVSIQAISDLIGSKKKSGPRKTTKTK
ncbi:mobilization protein (plasmid) [Pseudomonas yamanorum]|nr:mobilization protein [Pseudomonas yamanorum]